MIEIVKYTEIHKSIVNKLKSKLPTIKVTSEDVTEGFVRPSFFLSLDEMKASDFMNTSLDRNMTVRIYYFSTTIDKNKVELLKVQDDIQDLFLTDNVIKVTDYLSVEIQEIEFSVVDKVLHCYFDVMLSEDYNRVDNTPNMEELEVKI